MDTLGKDHSQGHVDLKDSGAGLSQVGGEPGVKSSGLASIRPSNLLRLLEPNQGTEMVAAAVGQPLNPLMAAAQKRLFRDFIAEQSGNLQGTDPSGSDLRLEWLRDQLRRSDNERNIGCALRAWSYSKLRGPDDPFADVHAMVALLINHDKVQDPEGVAASLVLLEKALRKCVADAPSPYLAALHTIIRATEAGPVFPKVIDAARRAGMDIDEVTSRVQASAATRSAPSAEAPRETEAVMGESERWAEALQRFDLSAHMASARAMSLLDQLLVRQAIASAVGTDGALDVKQLYALIDEVVRLNPNRHQTYHARGFVDAVCGKPIVMRFPLANDERRAWVLCGAILGTLRSSDEAAVASLIAEHASVFEILLSKSELYAGAWVLEPLYPLLRDQGRFDALGALFANHLDNLSPQSQQRVVGAVMGDARELILKGKAERAVDLLDALGPALAPPNDLTISGRDQTSFLQHALWRRGQAAMALGDFDRALGFFGNLRKQYSLPPSLEAKVLADVGLAKGQIRRIHDVFPASDKAATDHVVASLSKGMDEFLKAWELDGDAAVRSRLCLAVLASEARSTADAIAHLRSFLRASMSEKPGYYGEHSQAWTRYLLALAIMEAGDGSDYPNAADELSDALGSPGFVPPVYMCARLAEAFARAKMHESADKLMEAMEKHHPLALPQVVVDRGLEACSARGRECLLTSAQRPGASVDERITLMSRVAEAAIQQNDGDALSRLASVMQELGESDSAACGRYIAFADGVSSRLADSDLRDAFEESKLAMCRVAGLYEPIFARSKKVVEELLASDEEYDLAYARELLEDLEEIPEPWIR